MVDSRNCYRKNHQQLNLNSSDKFKIIILPELERILALVFVELERKRDQPTSRTFSSNTEQF